MLAKTDQRDAHFLADFGQTIRPRLFVGKSQERRRLSALVGRRNQLNEMLQAEKNRLRSSSVEVKSSVKRSIAFLKTKLRALEAQIQAFLKAHKDLGDQEKLLRTTMIYTYVLQRGGPAVRSRLDGSTVHSLL